MCVGTDRHTKSPRQPEVSQFDLTLGVDEQVLRFQVSVEHAMGVAECQTLKKLEQVALQINDRQTDIKSQKSLM